MSWKAFLTAGLATTAVIAKAALFLALPPLGLALSARVLGRWLPGFTPGLAGRTVGAILVAAGVYLTLRAGMVLACIGKEWPWRQPVIHVGKYIYSFTRHPLYLGYAAASIGLGLWHGASAFLVLAFAIAAALYAYAWFVEEPALLARFGERYRAYRRRVRFFWPHWRSLGQGALQLNLVLLFAVLLGRFLFRFFWRVKVEGQENLPEDGAHLLVANHSNLADPFLLGMFLIRPIRFIASDELFRRPVFRALFGLFFGALRKRRWNRDVGVLRQAERWLSQGEVVGIFPEGGRNWDGDRVIVGDEVYRFLHHCRVPIIAAAVIGGHEALPRWAGWPSFARMTIRFHPPVLPGECTTVQQLRERLEAQIFAGLSEPPALRTFWHSHRGLTTVAWACVKCGATRSMAETRTGLRCRQCGAAWRVTRRLELVDQETGQILLEREYHRLVKERLAAGTLQGTGAIWASVKAFRVNQLKLTPLGRGELSLDGAFIRFFNARHWVTVPIDQVSFAFLNMPGHLVVTDRKETMEYVFLNDSPVRWEDCLALARKDFVGARKKKADRGAPGMIKNCCKNLPT
ncbi:MAG: 1-acyl-sn-glycerol-3-phosphate acyltransferase [Bacteroidota bacterium]